MKKIINTAPMAVVTTLHTPQTLLLTLKAASGTLTQAQDITQNLWSPDRTLTPLVLESVFSAYDPDTKSRVSAAASLKWYANDVEIQTTATDSDYYRVDTDTGGIRAGSLVVRKNVSYTTPVTIRCEATYQGRTEKDEVVLTSENKPDVFYMLDLMTPNVVKYRPLEDASPLKTFKAFVQHGDIPLSWDDVVGKSINAVELGTLTWSKSGTTFTAALATAAKTDGGAALAGYTQDQALAADKTVSTATDGSVSVKDSTYSSADAFKKAMTGKILFYELATKTVSESFETAMLRLTGFFWYLDGELITADTFGYVSGQGTEQLTLNADYIDGSAVSVRLAVPSVATGQVVMPTTPSGPHAQSQLVWEWPAVEVLAIARGGNAVHQFSAAKTFDSIVRTDGQDMTDATKRATYIQTRWYTHLTSAAQDVRTYYGYGASVSIPGSALRTTGGVNVEVNTEITLLGALRPTIDQATGNYVTDATTGEVVFSREQTQITNTAPATVIITKKADLTTLLTIRIASGTLTQAQDITKNLWMPDRKLNPMKLEPLFSAFNPETKENVDLAPSIEWFVNDEKVTATSTTADYYLEIAEGTGTLTGNLIVRKNVSYGSQAVVRCKATYTDNLRQQQYYREADVTLTTENKPDTLFMVSLDVPAIVKFRPLQDESSLKTIKASVQYGDEVVTEDIAFFWYLNDTLITADTLGYVSGLGTDTLVLDADYFDGDVVAVRIGIPEPESEGSDVNVMPTAPNLGAQAQCTMVWDYGDIDMLPIARGGSSVRPTTERKVFDSVVRCNGKDVDAALVDKYIRLGWFTHATDESQDAKTAIGYGRQMTMDASQLRRGDGVNVEVSADIYVLGQMTAVVDDVSGETVVDDVTGETVVSYS